MYIKIKSKKCRTSSFGYNLSDEELPTDLYVKSTNRHQSLFTLLTTTSRLHQTFNNL